MFGVKVLLDNVGPALRVAQVLFEVAEQLRLRRRCRRRRRQKKRNTSALNWPLKTTKHSWPRLVLLDIPLALKRCPVPGITGVCPRRP